MVLLGNLSAESLRLESASVQAGSSIPKRFTCVGADVSPSLSWQGAPANTRSYVLILTDPDANSGTWTHWVLYNISASTNSLPANLIGVPAGATELANSWGQRRYEGPCPPAGERHHYIFHLYALDKRLARTHLNRDNLRSAMQGLVVASTELVTTSQQA